MDAELIFFFFFFTVYPELNLNVDQVFGMEQVVGFKPLGGMTYLQASADPFL